MKEPSKFDCSRFWDKVDRRGDDECWPWTAATSRGYGQFSVARSKWRGAHRISWAIANGRWPDDGRVLHKCDNKGCVNPTHLYLGDASENMADAVDRQNANKGVNNGQAKMSRKKVRKARKLYEETNVTQYELAEKYGITQDAMGCILRKETWTHV